MIAVALNDVQQVPRGLCLSVRFDLRAGPFVSNDCKESIGERRVVRGLGRQSVISKGHSICRVSDAAEHLPTYVLELV